jgi:hypothetical protein
MAADSADAWLILSELRTLIHEHIQHLRAVAPGRLSGTREFVERRCHDQPLKHSPNSTPACIRDDSTPFQDQGAVLGTIDRRSSETDFDGLESIEAKAQT